MTPDQIAALEKLSKEDWQFIHYAVEERYRKAAPGRGEPQASQAFKDERSRIEIALFKLAYAKN